VIAVEGISLEREDLQELSDMWRLGNTLRYTVERSGAQVDVPVPLVRWQLAPALNLLLAQNGGVGSILGVLALLAIAALAFYKRPGDHAARTLLLLAIFILVAGALVNLYISSPATDVFALASVIGFGTIIALFTILLPPTLLRLALVFPHPKPLVRSHPRLEYMPYLIGLAVIPLFLLTNGLAGYAWSIVASVATIGILIHSAFTMRDELSRAQLLWGLWGVILGMLMFLSEYLVVSGLVAGALADVVRFLTSMSFSVLGITLAIAILRYRLFDIDLIIRRTLIYGLLTAVLAAVYLGGVFVLEGLFRRLVGPSAQSQAAIVISTLLVAALFSPLRRTIQNLIDRRFFRRAYNAEQTLQTFAAAMRDEVDLDQLSQHLIDVVQDTVQPSSISLWVKRG
jgi:hypothetical protein